MVKSYVDSFLDPTCVPVKVSINKLNLVANWIVADLVGAFRNGGSLDTDKSYIPVMFFGLSCIYLSVVPIAFIYLFIYLFI